MRRPVPDPAALVTAVAARVDGLERDVAGMREDVTALGRGVADMVAQLRRLRTDPDGRTTSNPDGTGTPGTPPDDPDPTTDDADVDEDADEEDGQSDWLAVTDLDTARQWLGEAAEWARWVPPCHRLDLDETPCWPLHPTVVADLLALAAQRARAYADPAPTPVVEWLTRWLPAGLTRIRTETDPCRQDRGHRHDGRLYDTTGLTGPAGLDDVAAWWTTHRDAPAPTWLGLPHLD